MLSIKNLSIDMKLQDISIMIRKERDPIMKKFSKKLCNTLKSKERDKDLRVVIHPSIHQSTHPNITMKQDKRRITIIITKKLLMMSK